MKVTCFVYFSEGALEETKATEDADFCEDSTD